MQLGLWTKTAGGNIVASPDGFPEGMEQRGFNDSCREVMAQVRTWYDDPEWINLNYVGGVPATVTRQGTLQMRVAGIDLTSYYVSGRRIRITGAGTNDGDITSSAFSAGNTNINVQLDSFGNIPIGSNQILLHAIRSMRNAARYQVADIVGQIPLNTQSAVLGPAAYKDVTAFIGSVALHTQSANLAAFAYRASLADTFTAGTGTDQTTGSTAQVVVTDLNNIAIPATPDSVKKYRISATVVATLPAGAAGGGTAPLRLHIGTNGNATDTVVATGQFASVGASGSIQNQVVTFAGLVVTPAPATKVTLSVQGINGLVIKLGQTAGVTSWVDIAETGS